jgi:hypothetical protein
MEDTPENLAAQKPQLRPIADKPEAETPTPPTPKLKPRTDLDDPLRLTPEDRIRQALGLKPGDPLPEPKNLSPQMQRAIMQLEPASAHQVLAVMGGLQHLQEKAQATGRQVQEKISGSIENTKQVSFAQRTIIRRAEKGTLGADDIERARGMIASSGARGVIDTKEAGLDALLLQREEMQGAAQDMRQILSQQMPSGDTENPDQTRVLAFVDEAVNQQATQTSETVDTSWSQYKTSDLDRISLIVEAQDKARLEANAPRPQSLG